MSGPRGQGQYERKARGVGMRRTREQLDAFNLVGVLWAFYKTPRIVEACLDCDVLLPKFFLVLQTQDLAATNATAQRVNISKIPGIISYRPRARHKKERLRPRQRTEVRCSAY